jgi:hypothetical protein
MYWRNAMKKMKIQKLYIKYSRYFNTMSDGAVYLMNAKDFQKAIKFIEKKRKTKR